MKWQILRLISIYMQTSQVYKMLTNDVTKHLLRASCWAGGVQVWDWLRSEAGQCPYALYVTLFCTFTEWILPSPKLPLRQSIENHSNMPKLLLWQAMVLVIQTQAQFSMLCTSKVNDLFFSESVLFIANTQQALTNLHTTFALSLYLINIS